jgi:hypothetical protein
LTEENGNWQISLLNELYEKRGDAYLRASDYRHGVRDFNRIYKGIPNFAESTNRWRPLGTNSAGAGYYLDVKSAEFPPGGGVVRLWIKTVEKTTSGIDAYEIDCKGKLLNSTSHVTYDSSNTVTSSSDVESGWQHIVPDTIGEQFYQGACSTLTR